VNLWRGIYPASVSLAKLLSQIAHHDSSILALDSAQ
jgi:hypothetical protein